MRFIFSLFLIAVGVAIGFSAKYLVPDIMPTNIKIVEKKIMPVIGPVVSKELKTDSLLITIDTEQGAMLATFKKKVAEINLLVDEGDMVELSPRRYEPFINDPKIRRVTKGSRGFRSSSTEPSKLHFRKAALETPLHEDKEVLASSDPVQTEAVMNVDEETAGPEENGPSAEGH